MPDSSKLAYIRNGGTASITSDSAAVYNLSLGESLPGHLNQSGGQLNASSVYVGGWYGTNEGSYTITDGLLHVSSSITVGDYSPAYFRQLGGTVESVNVSLGNSATGRGNYELSGAASRLIANWLIIGPTYDSIGSFVQSGGSSTVKGIVVGNYPRANGRYELSDGTLVTDELHISYLAHPSGPGIGVLEQSGGSLTAAVLTLGSLGTYVFTAGTLNITNNLTVGGAIDFANTASVINVGDGASVDLSAATFRNAANASLVIGANSITTVMPGQDPNAMLGKFSTKGIIHTLGQPLLIPAGTTMGLSGQLQDHVDVAGTLTHAAKQSLTFNKGLTVLPGGTVDTKEAGIDAYYGTVNVLDATSGNQGGNLALANLYVAPQGTGAVFTQSAGTTIIRYDLQVAKPVGTSGTFIQTGGAVESGQIVVERGSGSIIHSGGTHTTHNLALGINGTSATYELSGNAQLNLTRSLPQYMAEARVGHQSSGSFKQTGGRFDVDGRLILGWNYTGRGSYTLSTGQVNVTELYAGYNGQGSITQTGGSVSVAEAAFLGYSGHSDLGVPRGTYDLSSGSLATKRLEVGHYGEASFKQSGGNVSVSEELIISYDTSGWPGSTYELSGGRLTAASESIGPGGEAFLKQTGGVNQVQRLTVHPQGRYEQSGGALIIGKNFRLKGKLAFGGTDPLLTVEPGASAFLSEGEILNASTIAVDAGPDSFITFPASIDPQTQLKSFHSDGIVHRAGQPLDIGNGRSIGGSGLVVGQVKNAGHISPGSSPGTLEFQGNYEQTPDGSLTIEIAGVNSGEYDLLAISGTASLGGSLEVRLLSNYLPLPRDRFTFLTASSVSGTFANAPTSVDVDFGRFDLTYSAGSVTLSNFHLVPEPNLIVWIAAVAVLGRRRLRR